jgi:hypothetical protein
MHTKEWLILCVTSHTSHIQNIQKGTIRVRHPYDSIDVLSVQRSHPSHHQYLHSKKLHLYRCGGSHIRIGEGVSSPPKKEVLRPQ